MTEEWLSTEPIKAYRNLIYDRDENRVVGPVQRTIEMQIPESGKAKCRSWTGALNRTLRNRGMYDRVMPYAQHTSPEEQCSCGFYALKRLREYGVGARMATDMIEALQKYPIILECDLYGKVIEHEHFYRAEEYIVTAIILNRKYVRKNDPVVQELRDKYKVEVKVRNIKGAVR